jgi:hypothetical protein
MGDQQRSEILVGIADELHVLEAVVHDFADALVGGRRPLGGLSLRETIRADDGHGG